MQTWLLVIVVGAGVVLAVLGGMWAYVSATPPLHPTAGDVKSVAHADAAKQWAAAAAEAREIVRASLAQQNLPGLSVAVGAGGEIVWAEGFGWADLEGRVAVTPDTRFRIGTASTALTSAAVGLLLEKGKLNLDENIRSYVPEFPEKQWPVTLRQLMGHVAGVRTDSGDEGPLLGTHCERPVEGLQVFAEKPLLFEPGTDFRYSSYGWILMSAAVEAAAGEPFLSFIRRQVFEPLGMSGTRADDMRTDDSRAGAEPMADLATSYFPRMSAEPRYGPDVNREIDLSCYAGSSVFLSTPSDMVRFAIAVNSGTLLQPATVRLLQTSQRLSSGKETSYGLGWDLESVTLAGTPARVIGHDGELMGGRVMSLMTFPEHGIVVALTSNISYSDTFALGSKLAQAFAEQAKNTTVGDQVYVTFGQGDTISVARSGDGVQAIRRAP
ncbi:MAG: beta-lactamase family protein [Acidobacteriota bacterium]|nr:beta-lactamase family protein [Acidobacteriota bacterium]